MKFITVNFTPNVATGRERRTLLCCISAPDILFYVGVGARSGTLCDQPTLSHVSEAHFTTLQLLQQVVETP